MNNDLISREALITAIEDHFDNLDVYFPSAFIKEVENAPTVELDEGVIQEILNKRCMTAVANEYLIALHGKRPQGDIRWTDKVFVKSNGDIIDFEGRVVGHINLEDMKGGAE